MCVISPKRESKERGGRGIKIVERYKKGCNIVEQDIERQPYVNQMTEGGKCLKKIHGLVRR